MFVHSEKVPRLYKTASKYLKEIIENGSSLKSLIYNQTKFPNVRALYALLTKAVQHFSEINHIIDNAQLLNKEPKFDPWLARVLITQMFWSNKGLEGTCKPIATILSYRAALENHKLKKGDEATMSKVTKPRYVRVNTLAVSLEEAVSGFRNEGWELVHCSGETYDDFISNVGALEHHQFMVDVHVKELFIFPPKTEFYTHEAYKCKSIILQDKASCLPVQLLNPPPGSTVLDMCAAPGMKTTFLAAWLNNHGVVYAVERNIKRYDTLNTVIEGTYSTCIKTINEDALLVTPEQCPNVEYILVDPSCSGSGITDRLTVDDEVEMANARRLYRLSYFQQLLLKHALKNFPQAKRVVYSTCSIYAEENEGVVDEVLKDNVNFKLVQAHRLLNYPFNKPKQLGDNLDYIRSCCIHTIAEDLTNGFFIAVFERNEASPNEVQVPDQDFICQQTDVQVKKKKEKIELNLDNSQEAENVEGMPKQKKKSRKNYSYESREPLFEKETRSKNEVQLENLKDDNTKSEKRKKHIEFRGLSDDDQKKRKSKAVTVEIDSDKNKNCSNTPENQNCDRIDNTQEKLEKKKKHRKEDLKHSTQNIEKLKKNKKSKLGNCSHDDMTKDEGSQVLNQSKIDKKKRRKHSEGDVIDDQILSSEVVDAKLVKMRRKEKKIQKEKDRNQHKSNEN